MVQRHEPRELCRNESGSRGEVSADRDGRIRLREQVAQVGPMIRSKVRLAVRSKVMSPEGLDRHAAGIVTLRLVQGQVRQHTRAQIFEPFTRPTGLPSSQPCQGRCFPPNAEWKRGVVDHDLHQLLYLRRDIGHSVSVSRTEKIEFSRFVGFGLLGSAASRVSGRLVSTNLARNTSGRMPHRHNITRHRGPPGFGVVTNTDPSRASTPTNGPSTHPQPTKPRRAGLFLPEAGCT